MQVLRARLPEVLISFMLLAQEMNWWLPTEKTVYITKKPKEIVLKNGEFVKLIYQDNYAMF
jgi:hypothetical protein